jgi:uncharacterized protein DUF3617
MRIVLVLLLGIAAPAWSQALQPGEWELTTTTASRILTQPQSATFKRCLNKEDAANPEALLSREANKNDCKVTPGARAGDTYNWEVSCAKPRLRGTGTATVRGNSLQSEMQLKLEVQGQSLPVTTRTTGRRLGACQT